MRAPEGSGRKAPCTALGVPNYTKNYGVWLSSLGSPIWGKVPFIAMPRAERMRKYVQTREGTPK